MQAHSRAMVPPKHEIKMVKYLSCYSSYPDNIMLADHQKGINSVQRYSVEN